MTTNIAQTIRLHADDNVIIALRDLGAGHVLPDQDLSLRQAVPRGHKVATQAISAGQNVIRYGQIIGAASVDIAAGDHVHSHNLGMGAHDQDYAYSTEDRKSVV